MLQSPIGPYYGLWWSLIAPFPSLISWSSRSRRWHLQTVTTCHTNVSSLNFQMQNWWYLIAKLFLLRKCFDALKTRLKMSEIAPFQNNRRHYQCLQVNRREQALNKRKQKERDWTIGSESETGLPYGLFETFNQKYGHF